MWHFHFFFHNLAPAIIIARIFLRDPSIKSLEGALYSYCDIVNFFLATYATEDFIAEAENDTTG